MDGDCCHTMAYRDRACGEKCHERNIPINQNLYRSCHSPRYIGSGQRLYASSFSADFAGTRTPRLKTGACACKCGHHADPVWWPGVPRVEAFTEVGFSRSLRSKSLQQAEIHDPCFYWRGHRRVFHSRRHSFKPSSHARFTPSPAISHLSRCFSQRRHRRRDIIPPVFHLILGMAHLPRNSEREMAGSRF